jgi:hypothetical protein
MKQIIRRVLKEHIELTEIHLNEIILDSSFNSFLLNEGKSTIEYPRSLDNELKKYIEGKYNWPQQLIILGVVTSKKKLIKKII